MTTAVINNIDKHEQRIKNVFRVIISLCTNGWHMDMAQTDAEAGLKMEGNDLLMQVAFVLINLQYWRGDEARRCKKVLKEFGGVR